MDFIQKDVKVEQLNAILEAIFGCRKVFYVTRKDDCWLLLKKGNLFFIFDPQGIEYPGKKKSYNRAVLYRIKSLHDAIIQLMECIQCDPSKGDSVLDLGCIFIKGVECKEDKKKIKPKIICQ